LLLCRRLVCRQKKFDICCAGHACASDQRPAASLSSSARQIIGFKRTNLTEAFEAGCMSAAPGHVGSRNKGLISTKDSHHVLTLDLAFAIIKAFLVERNRVWQGYCPIAVRINGRWRWWRVGCVGWWGWWTAWGWGAHTIARHVQTIWCQEESDLVCHKGLATACRNKAQLAMDNRLFMFMLI